MTSLYRTSASTLVLCAFAAAVQAQDIIVLDDVIVSANTTPTDASSTGSVVEVVDPDALTVGAPTKAVDGLARLPGVSVSANGGFGNSTALRIRGLSTQYVSVRLNGIDITDPATTQTQYNWGSLTTAGLGRIEVLKGSQSALYGSEAIGGVVSLYSKQPEELGTSVDMGLEIGSYNTVRADTTIATKGERGQISLTLSSIDSDGFSAAEEDDGNTEADAYSGQFALLSASFDATDNLTLGVDVIYQDEANNIDAFGGAGGDADRPFYTDRRGVRGYAQFDTGIWAHEVAASYFETERRDPLSSFSQRFFGERTEVSYNATGDFGSQILTFGANYSEEKAEFSNGDADYSVASIFGAYQHKVSDVLDYTAALRIDDHSDFGTHTTGRLALAYEAAPGTVIRTSLGTGFRAPSLNELFGPFNTTPPTLDPEESRSFELGVSHMFSPSTEVEATFFYTEIDNLIGFGANGYEQVTGESISQGVELSGEYDLGNGFTVYGAYTYTDATDANGNQLRRVPEHDIVLGLDADLSDRLSASLSWQRSVGRADDGFPSGPMADYSVVNASVSYAITDDALVYLRIENLLDEEYQTSAGYGTSDRAAYVGLRASF